MINICIIHYNTPKLTECLIGSINKFTPNSRIYIFDNSDKEPFTYKQKNIVYMDNTKGQIIDFNKWLNRFPDRHMQSPNNYASAKHCYSIQKCINIIKRNFILLDSDVLLKDDISKIADENYLCVGEKYLQWNKKTRIAPFLCYINVEKCRELNISYFNKDFMHGLHKDAEKDAYDTGRWFYEQVKNNLREIKMSNYIVHYGGGSWEYEHNHRNTLMNNIGNRNKLETVENWMNRHKDLWGDEKIIVTLTTWRDRISNIPTVLNTILLQTKLPNKIIINLSREEFPNNDIPQEVEDYIKKHEIIELNWIEGKNTKQWKKIIPTLFKYPNDCVICIDDDSLYPCDFIECLWNTHIAHPNNPITRNKTYRFKGKYLQHAGNGTLDKLEFYNGFENIDLEPIYNLASSDTFFTLIAKNSGHPILPYEGTMGKIETFNEVNPLKNSQGTSAFSTHNKMYDYLIEHNIISADNLGEHVYSKKESTQRQLYAFTDGMIRNK